ncbi:hypothetical protein P1J78_22865 [Psychromarinibacter sp. C21-152]|uniref:Uncharacterized protein n=1 Tax=Psychromarinibacter sediminicola TaxID=3033385 RepID=A0AAE3NWJ8_9RHOB|nr:hypothetical protein [Psychromarinibacter sediminicola]MDF0603576.1 hypothetical protein [Psychromarinibacter sediminicola]
MLHETTIDIDTDWGFLEDVPAVFHVDINSTLDVVRSIKLKTAAGLDRDVWVTLAGYGEIKGIENFLEENFFDLAA